MPSSQSETTTPSPAKLVHKKARRSSPHTAEWSMLAACLLAVAISLGLAWQNLNPEQYEAVSSVMVETKNTPKAVKLELHHDYKRRGEAITVDPAEIGKPNPFE